MCCHRVPTYGNASRVEYLCNTAPEKTKCSRIYASLVEKIKSVIQTLPWAGAYEIEPAGA